MFRRVGARYWYRLVWVGAMVIFVLTDPTWQFGKPWLNTVWVALLVAYFVDTAITIIRRLRTPADELKPAPPLAWDSTWITPPVVGVLVLAFVIVFFVAR